MLTEIAMDGPFLSRPDPGGGYGMKTPMQKRRLVLAGISALFLILGPYGDHQVSALDRGTYKHLKTFNEVLDMVEKNYVEDIEAKTLIQGAINGMMKSLDPHSAYMTPEMYKELEVETRGSFGGLGIEITLLRDILTVVAPIEDTPAYQAGIKPGDQIVKIDGQSTKDITILEAVKKLRGPKDTKVTLTIVREGLTNPKDVVVTRAIINVKSVKAKAIEPDIAYIRVLQFQERTGEDLKKALREVTDKGQPLRGLILDMRNNPGGLLNQAVEVSDLFIKSGVIVSTRGRAKSMETKSMARDDGDEPACPMIILVNEGTASAAEIVSGALQDNGRALILGTQTFGKGSVQTVIPLEDGSAVKLTTAKYYTPKGRSIQAEGIAPDVIVKFIRPAEERDQADEPLRERDLRGHIRPQKENGPPAEELRKETDLDNQLKAAIDILKSWDVFRKNMRS